jgi:hypothetical protein
MKVLTVVRGAAAARLSVGMALVVGAQPILRTMLRDEKPSDSFVLFVRTLGVRDVVFATGCLLAALDTTRPDATRRWVQLWLASEVGDVLTALAMWRQLGAAGAGPAAVLPLPVIAADIWTLRQLASD